MKKHFSKSKKFVSVNAQINAATNDKHSLNNYKNIDMLIVNESELRNHIKDFETDIKI